VRYTPPPGEKIELIAAGNRLDHTAKFVSGEFAETVGPIQASATALQLMQATWVFTLCTGRSTVWSSLPVEHVFKLAQCAGAGVPCRQPPWSPGSNTVTRTSSYQHCLQDWPVDVGTARAVQEALRDRVIREDTLGPVHTIAGVDVGFEKGGQITRAAVAVLDFPGLDIRDQSISHCPTGFPYIPGYLSFRELPAALRALERLATPPDLLLCDGQGLAHPRRFGLACHIGVLTGLPCIGVAKSRLIGTHEELPANKGQWVPLEDAGEIIGAVVRTRSNVSPVYVSIGHRVSLETAIDYVLRATTRYRLPETTRRAHRLASG